MSKAIAVVEDDESIREMLRYYFQSVGYAVRPTSPARPSLPARRASACPPFTSWTSCSPAWTGWRFSAACGRGGTLPTYP